MPLDPRKEEIFAAWHAYEHPVDEDAKLAAKRRRNSLIQELLIENKMVADVTLFLRFFHKDYLEWQVGEGLKKPGRRRF